MNLEILEAHWGSIENDALIDEIMSHARNISKCDPIQLITLLEAAAETDVWERALQQKPFSDLAQTIYRMGLDVALKEAMTGGLRKAGKGSP